MFTPSNPIRLPIDQPIEMLRDTPTVDPRLTLGDVLSFGPPDAQSIRKALRKLRRDGWVHAWRDR